MQQPVRIAIVGFGGVFPGADDLDQFWSNIVRGQDCSSEVPPGRWILPPEKAVGQGKEMTDRVTGVRGCFVENWQCSPDGLDIDPKLLGELDPVFHLTLKAGSQAIRACKQQIEDLRRVSVVFGNIILPTEYSSRLAREYIGSALESRILGDSQRRTTTNPLNHFAAALPAGVLSKALGLGGGCYTIDAACASSLYALKLAVDELLAGHSDAVLAGGVSRPDHLYTQMGFTQLTALSKAGRSRPFDAKGDGLVVGEGAGFFVLKRLDDARRCNDEIHGVITGIGLSNDIDGGLMAPSSEGQLRSMRTAYQQAGIDPSAIDLIECHATGTPVGDAVEFNSLTSLWGSSEQAKRCVIGSVKANIGHLLTAAGSSGLCRILLALRHKTLPPTANFVEPSTRIPLDNSPFEVLKNARPWLRRSESTPRRAAISGFGFGGINAHLIIEEWDQQISEPDRVVVAPLQRQSLRQVAIIAAEACVANHDNLDSLFEFACVQRQEFATAYPQWKGIAAPERDRTARQVGVASMTEINIPLGKFRIPPIELQQMLPQQLLMLVVADRALSAAGIKREKNLYSGVFIGLGLDSDANAFSCRWEIDANIEMWAKKLGLELNEQQLLAWATALKNSVHSPLNANRTMGSLGGLVASRIAREFQFGGPGFTLSNEGNSGLRALQVASRQIAVGELEMAVVGAVDFAAQLQTSSSLTTKLNRTKHSQRQRCHADGAAAVVLKELDAARRDGNPIIGIIDDIQFSGQQFQAGVASPPHNEVDLSRHNLLKNADVGAADGMVNLVLSLHCLARRLIPQMNGPQLQPWLRNRNEGPRSFAINFYSTDHNYSKVHVTEAGGDLQVMPRKIQPFGFFALRTEYVSDLSRMVSDLRTFADNRKNLSINALAKAWWNMPTGKNGAISLALVSTDASHLQQQLQMIEGLLKPGLDLFSETTSRHLRAKGAYLNYRSHFSKDPIGFLYPGVGQQYLGMGRRFCLAFPEILEKQDQENGLLKDQFFTDQFWYQSDDNLAEHSNGPAFGAQVTLGTIVTDVLYKIGIRPNAVLGYSLGESTGLVATGVWQARDDIYMRLVMSPLFKEYLGGAATAVCKHWGLPAGSKVNWAAYTVRSTAEDIRIAIKEYPRVYLMNINTYRECVIGGDRQQVEAVIARLGSESIEVPGLAAIHCPVVREVEAEYRQFHAMDPVEVSGIRYYSCASGEIYPIEKEAIAASLLRHGIEGVNYPKVIEQAYADGIRIFVDIGPGRSLSRMVTEILGDREHIAVSLCPPGDQEVHGFLRGLALLYSLGLELDMSSVFEDDQAGPTNDVHDANPSKNIRIAVGQDDITPVKPPLRQGATAETKKKAALPVPQVRPDQVKADIYKTAVLPRINEIKLTHSTLHNSDLVSAMAGSMAASSAAHQHFILASGKSMAMMADWISTQQELIARGANTLAPLSSIIAPPAVNREASAQTDGFLTYDGYNDEVRPMPLSKETPWLDYSQCKEFAAGRIANVLGNDFAEIDQYPTRVRLPDGPLLLCHRMMSIDAVPKSMSHGTLVTEHDIFPNAWYLDGGRIPTCIAVEAGQADLFLSSYLGIDFQNRGRAVYRLLDAVVTFYEELPKAGETIRYEINIAEFFSQGATTLFRFNFEATVNGRPLLSMRQGCAGFFSEDELANGRGIVLSSLDQRPLPGKLTGGFVYPLPLADERYSDKQLDCLRVGDFAGCFGPLFADVDVKIPGKLPGGMMKLVHRITGIKPGAGRYGLGVIYGEADIHPDDWFLACHFVDDKVMPGTLMYECCLHTLRVYLMRIGWVGEYQDMVYEPIPGQHSKLKCRGQVLNTTKKVTYEIVVKEIGYRPEAYAIVDAYMYADGKMIVEISNMTTRMTGITKEKIDHLWRGKTSESALTVREIDKKPAIFDYERIRAFCEGRPSEAFGKAYEIFDNDQRQIARLPREPFCFMTRITKVDARPWVIEAGGKIEAEYDVAENSWYFAPENQGKMPFSILLETALQPCGWYSAYMGSALASEQDLKYRNLGGQAVQHAPVTPWIGTLRTEVECIKVSQSGGMLIQEFRFKMTAGKALIYSGNTMFGFFSAEALAQQVGVRGAKPIALEKHTLGISGTAYPAHESLPVAPILMVDEIQLIDPNGGSQGLGYIQGRKRVNPSEWFFKAHFYQDPVMPGSLGLETFVQLLKILGMKIFNLEGAIDFDVPALASAHEWVYRGQVIPSNKDVTVEVNVLAVDHSIRMLTASGYLLVDGLVIYEIKRFALRLR